MSDCGCNKKKSKQFITQAGCSDICEDLQSISKSGATIPISDAELLDLSGGECSIVNVTVPPQKTACEQIHESIGSAIEKPLNEIHALDLSDGGCSVSIPDMPSACDILKDAFSGPVEEKDIDDVVVIDIAGSECKAVKLAPPKTVCEQVKESTDLGYVGIGDATFYGEVDDGAGGFECGTFKLDCTDCPTEIFTDVTGGGICLTIDAGNSAYNSYTEGGHASVSSIFNEVEYTNDRDYPTILEVYWPFEVNRYPPSQYVKAQVIGYLGPPEFAPTGQGDDVALGTTTFSGIEETDPGSVDYAISEVVAGWHGNPDGYGPDTIFEKHVTQHPSRPGETWPYPVYENPTHHSSDRAEVKILVQPGETKTIIGSWVIRFNEDLVSAESFYLLGKMTAIVRPAGEVV